MDKINVANDSSGSTTEAVAAKRPLFRKGSLADRIYQNRAVYLMLSPVIVGFFVFTLYPQVWVLSLSFFRYDGFREPTWLGLQNFVRLFQRDPLWWRSVWNTAYFTFGKLAIELPLALVLAVVLNRNLFGRHFFRGLFFLPHVTSTAIMALVFYFIYAPYQGILNGLLLSLGMIPEPIDWLGTGGIAMISTMMVSVWQNFGINMVLFLAGLQAIPDDLYESAEIDGANSVQQFFYITIPALGRMLQVIVMLAIIGSLKSFDLFRVLTRGGPGTDTTVMMLYIFNYFFDRGALGASTVPQYGYASALGVVATVIIGAVTGFYLWWSRRLGRNQE